MRLENGARLGPYEIRELVRETAGEEVYRARGSRDDEVEVRVLPAGASAESRVLTRYAHEARAASGLHHPSIAVVHDVGAHEGHPYVVSEPLAGIRLRERLRGAPLPLDEALRMGIAIAQGLGAAHDAGILHRDLRPDNVLVTADGGVKLLDFGRAILEPRPTFADTAAGSRRAAGLATRPEVIAYTAPEVLQGRLPDARSDIFSFGALLYEMAGGRRAFAAESSADTATAILTRDPPELPGGPSYRALDRILRRCLAKEPEDRFRSLPDLALALQMLADLGSPEGARPAPASRRAGRWAVLAAAALVFAAGTGLAWWMSRGPAVSIGGMLRRVTSDAGLTTDPTLSADGQQVAYASDRGGEGNLDIWVQKTAGSVPVRLSRHHADDWQPSFAPDGGRIVFRSEREGGGIYLVPASGGGEEKLLTRGFWPRFSPDGRSIAYVGGGGGLGAPLFVMSADGAERRELPVIVSTVTPPLWSPDGRHLLVVGGTAPDAHFDWMVVPAPADGEVRSSAVVSTGAVATLAGYALLPTDPQTAPEPFDWAGHRILFSATQGDTTNIWEIGLSRAFAVTGPPRRITMGMEVEGQPCAGPGGQVVFSARSASVELAELPVEADEGRPIGEPRLLTHDLRVAKLPALSADGRTLVYLSARLGSPDIWVKNLADGSVAALTANAEEELLPVLTRDGSRVTYLSVEETKSVLYAMSLSGSVQQRICADCGSPTDVSRNGRMVLVLYFDPRGAIGLVDAATGTRRPVLAHEEYSLYRGHFSPDEKWIVFHADRPGVGTTRVFIAPFHPDRPTPEEEWIPVTNGEAFDDAPRWSPDGSLIYYVSDRDGFRCLWVQRLSHLTKKPVEGPFPLRHFHSRHGGLRGVPLQALDLAVGKDRIVYNVAEQRGNLWMVGSLD